MQKPQITEIQVRMDCNGCVQKIKKVLSGINGIYDICIDFPQQKITVVGWADQEKIVKAIKKTRKTAPICSLVEPMESPSQPAEPGPAQEGNEPAPHHAQQPPAEVQQAETAPPAEPPPEQPPSEATPPTDNNASQQSQNIPGTKDVGEIHENQIYRYPPNYANRFGSDHNYGGSWHGNHNSPVHLQEPSLPIYVTHSYNTYMPSPYVTEYEYVGSPPRHSHYSRMEYYSGDYQNGNANITSIFSDENPNACCII